jgi:hypothetical protein
MPSRRSDASIAERMCLRDRPPAFSPLPHRHEHLGGHDHLVALEELAEQPPGGHLAGPAGVDVRGVEEDHAAFGRDADDRLGGILIQHPRPITVVPEAHHPEAHARHAHARRAKVDVLHDHLMIAASSDRSV